MIVIPATVFLVKAYHDDMLGEVLRFIMTFVLAFIFVGGVILLMNDLIK